MQKWRENKFIKAQSSTEIKWRAIPTFEKLQAEFIPARAEKLKDFIDTKAYNAWTVNGRMNFVDTYNYMLYLEMLVDKLKIENQKLKSKIGGGTVNARRQ